VPREVIAEARRYLEQLESERERHRATAAGHSPHAAQTELPLFESTPDELRAALRQVDPDQLSPKAALEILYQLKALLR